MQSLEDNQLCGAKTRSGKPCRNIAFADNGRCKFHGGLSTGPRDPSKLKGNKNAVGNKGGGAPKGNRNAAKRNQKSQVEELIIPWGGSVRKMRIYNAKPIFKTITPILTTL